MGSIFIFGHSVLGERSDTFCLKVRLDAEECSCHFDSSLAYFTFKPSWEVEVKREFKVEYRLYDHRLHSRVAVTADESLSKTLHGT